MQIVVENLKKLLDHVYARLYPKQPDLWVGTEREVHFHLEVIVLAKILKNCFGELSKNTKNGDDKVINHYIDHFLEKLREIHRHMNIVFHLDGEYQLEISNIDNWKTENLLKQRGIISKPNLPSDSELHVCGIYVHRLCLVAEIKLLEIRRDLFLTNTYAINNNRHNEEISQKKEIKWSMPINHLQP